MRAPHHAETFTLGCTIHRRTQKNGQRPHEADGSAWKNQPYQADKYYGAFEFACSSHTEGGKGQTRTQSYEVHLRLALSIKFLCVKATCTEHKAFLGISLGHLNNLLGMV